MPAEELPALEKETSAPPAPDTIQQATKPAKNPMRVAAWKAVAEKTGLARKAQKKALVEANVIIANHKAKKSSQ